MQHIKRILSLALALVMVLSLVPTIAFAADSTPALPAAKVYQTKNDDLTFALNFRINTVSEEQLAYYGNWYADFELTVNKEVTFNSDGSADGWLSGQYDEWSYDWVNVPFGNNASVTLQANETVKIMAFAAEYMNKAGLKYTFKEVYETVKDFYCGVYFDDAFLAANPDLVVTLELKMYNPADAAESYVIGETYTFTNPIVAQNVNTGKVYAGVDEAMMDAQANETVIVLKDTTESILTVYTDTTLDLNGYTLAASYVSCFGDIIDSSAANSGLLAVPTNRFLVRNDNVQLPVRNGNGYRFVEVLGFNTTMDGPTKFVFQPLIETGALAWLKAGTDASGVTIQVQISWMQSDGLRTQDFVYNDSLLVEFIDSHKGGQSYRKVFTLTLNGVENIEALTFTAVVVSENGVSFTPDTLRQPKPTGNVTTNSQNQVVNDVTIGNGNASALVPSGTQLESGANNVTLSATAMEKTTSNITVGDGEQLISMNVHVNGVAANNTTPIIVTLNELAPEALNQGNVNLYHVENGETVLMTRVYSLAEVDAHNEYYYDIPTGTVTMALATFSEIAVLSDTENGWNGDFNYEWYNTTDIEFEIYNADQLAALGAIVGGMAEGIERDSFKGKTIKLLADINLADAEDDGKIFYPIGYWNNTLSYEHVSGNPNGTAVSSGFYPFEGTFDGNGNTISNFYQNTWEMFGDYNDGYSGTPNYYRDGMGLFGKVYGGTVMNLTVDNFESDGEFTTTGCIAAYADCGAVFQNISITNCNPRVYNIGNGGIVGCVGWYAKEADTKVTFENITVDNTNIISALWGSWDVACGGIVGQYYPTSGQTSAGKPSNGGIDLINCHVAAQIDVYNDVCANYQYYAYRYSGMLIGSVRENVTIEGHSYPKMDGITATGCSVFFGDWNDYYYCELVANSLASYTHDHQMSRLTQVLSVDPVNKTVTDLDGNVSAIPESGRYNYVVVKNKDPKTGAWLHGDGAEFAECFHFVNGNQHFHNVADGDNTDIHETVNGVEVLKEDKQLIYREFKNLVTGYGWGVTSRGFNNLDGVDNFGVIEGKGEDSIVKFVPVVGAGTSLVAGQPISIGKLFAANTGIASVIDINNSNVQVFVSPADETSTARGSFVGDEEDWTKGALVLRGTGKAVVTITDYYYCTATTLVVDVLRDDAVVTNTPAANVIPNSTFGDLKDVTSYPFTATTGIGYTSSAFVNITADITDRYASEGTYSMHLVHTAAKSAGSIYQDIPITADMIGKELVLSVDRRGTSDEKMTYMHLQFYGLGDTGKADQALTRSDYSFFKSSATWVTNSVKVTVPDDAVKVRAYIAYIKTGSDADVYFDNVVLTCDGEPITLTNPSFETMLPSGTPNETNEFVLNAKEWKPSAPDNCIVSIQKEPGNETNGILVFEDHNDQKYARADTYYLPVIPGQSYTLSFRFKASEDTQGAQIRVYIRGGNNEYLVLNPKTGKPVASDFSEIATTEWSICTKETIVIPDTVTELYVTLTASTDDGILYMDDFILTANCSIHTWGEADVIEAATCTVAGTSVRACVNCGATETVSAKIAHAWDNGVCGSCGIDCEHDVYGGVCLICKAELPVVEHDNLIDNGTFDNDAGWNPSPKYSNDTKDVRYATITGGKLYLYDNDLTAYPQAWYGGADKTGIPIKEGKTYIFKLKYAFDPKVKNVDEETAGEDYHDFQLTIALRANQSSSTAGNLGSKSVKYVSGDETTGTIEISFTVDSSKESQWDKDSNKNPINPPKTFYVMLYTNKAATGAVWVDDISLVEVCDSHSWILSDVKDPTCTDAGVRTVICEHCGITATSEIPALGHHWPNGFCVRCHEKKEELM